VVCPYARHLSAVRHEAAAPLGAVVVHDAPPHVLLQVVPRAAMRVRWAFPPTLCLAEGVREGLLWPEAAVPEHARVRLAQHAARQYVAAVLRALNAAVPTVAAA